MKKHRVLIVDDEHKMRRILQIILGNRHYNIDLVGNGLEARDFFRQHPYDLVITDLKMPGMDGLALLDFIRGEKPDVPVIVITAHGSVESAVNAMKAGAFDYITKPFENEAIRMLFPKRLLIPN